MLMKLTAGRYHKNGFTPNPKTKQRLIRAQIFQKSNLLFKFAARFYDVTADDKTLHQTPEPSSKHHLSIVRTL